MEIIINDSDNNDENNINSITIKVVLIGETGTGKTAFISIDYLASIILSL